MKKILGVLGGMGPQATVDLLQKIVALTAAASDQEHMRIYVDNYPQIPERISSILKGTASPAPVLQQALDQLAEWGAQCIVMPCVTAHYFLPQLRIPAGVQFLSMLDVTVKACVTRHAEQCAGLLASPGTLQSGLLTSALAKADIQYLEPLAAEQEELGRLIYGVKAGESLPPIVERFNAVIEAMSGRGADYFALGCTELPLIAQAFPPAHVFVDATTELAKAAILACGYELKAH